MENQVPTVQQIVSQVINTAALMSATAGPATFGLIEALKKIGLKTRFIGVISIVCGFLISILFGRLFTGSFWSTFNIAVGVVVGCGIPGLYSAIKTIGNKEVTS